MRVVIFAALTALVAALLTTVRAANPQPSIYLIYVTEESHSSLHFTIPHSKFLSQCLVADNTQAHDSRSAVDEAGRRFNCKNAAWYDLTCTGNPQRAPAQEPPAGDYYTVLVDISDSMGKYDPSKEGTCYRSRLVQRLALSGKSIHLHWHNENLSTPINLNSSSYATLNACQNTGDNALIRVLDRALIAHNNSHHPLIVITDASEQNTNLNHWVQSHKVREVWTTASNLIATVMQYVR